MWDTLGNIDTYAIIKSALDTSVTRSKVIAHNVSNINTKGFKASRVHFEDELRNVLDNRGVKLEATDKDHITKKEPLAHEVKVDKATSMREDGNNVDIDNEMVNSAANSLMYNFLVDRAKGKLSGRMSIINGGK